MCLFVEKLLSFKKVCCRGPKGPQKNRPKMPKKYMYCTLTFIPLYYGNGVIWLTVLRSEVVDLRSNVSWFESHQRHCVVSLSKTLYVP